VIKEKNYFVNARYFYFVDGIYFLFFVDERIILIFKRKEIFYFGDERNI
jgi:CRISPR/Cas system CMR-associated protein Cmr3 (group 5 of RAMP superfamily)